MSLPPPPSLSKAACVFYTLSWVSSAKAACVTRTLFYVHIDLLPTIKPLPMCPF
jgi:hypothetical protein